MNYIICVCTVWGHRMAHRIWKETKQQPSMLPAPAVPGFSFVSFHFLWAILCPQAVHTCLWDIMISFGKAALSPQLSSALIWEGGKDSLKTLTYSLPCRVGCQKCILLPSWLCTSLHPYSFLPTLRLCEKEVWKTFLNFPQDELPNSSVSLITRFIVNYMWELERICRGL